MHRYLRAIGFSMPDKKTDVDILIMDAVRNYDKKMVTTTASGKEFAEFTREYAPECGIKVCGEYVEDDFHVEYYFPYMEGSVISTSEDIIIERQADKEAYMGACDDMRLDITLIFHLINTGEYLQYAWQGGPEQMIHSASLSGLSVEGMIILPIAKKKEDAQERQKKAKKRTALIMAARNGDEAAMESLTVEDMDTYDMVSKRSKNEDIYSIVDNCFMPYGLGTDIYSVVGDINAIEYQRNSYTGDELCKLGLDCKGIMLDVCINTKDLIGEPMIGRRFKGIIWLQGKVDF